jgi:UPF0755 protein
MTVRKRRTNWHWTAPKVLGAMFLLGLTAALLAAGSLWVLSDDTAGLPPAAGDLSSFNSLYLRAYLRWNLATLNAASAGADGIFEVREGESATDVSGRLQTEGWVPSADLVAKYLVYSGGDRRIGAGLYLIRVGESPRQIADSIVSGESRVRTLTVFAGWRREEVAQALTDSSIDIAPADFLAATSGRPGAGGELDVLYSQIPAGASLEGFLLPGTYNVLPGESAASLASRMVGNFLTSVSPDLRAALQAHGLTLYQAVTLASIVQREAMLEEEMPLIASVYYNRLQSNMRLEADPTVQYAVGYQATRGKWWANPLTDADFGVESPYNTYIVYGLPPGPISNPSLAALQAVAAPADSSFLFFRAACDGSGRHLFAETYLQHLANACGN